MSTPSGPTEPPEVYYKHERDSARSGVLNPLTAEYIKKLETIARAAHHVWITMEVQPFHTEAMRARDTLYDELSTVNFLDEDV